MSSSEQEQFPFIPESSAILADKPILTAVPAIEEDSFGMANLDELVELDTAYQNALEVRHQPEEEVDYSFHGFKDRLWDSLGTWWGEQTEEGYRLKRAGAFTLGLGTQVADRWRYPMVWALTRTFDNSLTYGIEHGWENYQTVGLGSLAVGGVFGVATYGVGKAFKTAIDVFPKTAEVVIDNHPAMVGSVSRAVNGFPTEAELEEAQPVKPEAGYDVGPYDTHDTVLGKVVTGVARGSKAGIAFGTTPHVGLAKVWEHSSRSSNRRLETVAAESGVFWGSVAGVVGTLVVNSSTELAQTIKEALANKNYVYAATALFIGWGILGNWGARRKEVRLAAKEAAEAEQVEDNIPVVAMA